MGLYDITKQNHVTEYGTKLPWLSQIDGAPNSVDPEDVWYVVFDDTNGKLAPTNLQEWFKGYVNLKGFDGTGMDASNAHSFEGLFSGDVSLDTLNIQTWDMTAGSYRSLEADVDLADSESLNSCFNTNSYLVIPSTVDMLKDTDSLRVMKLSNNSVLEDSNLSRVDGIWQAGLFDDDHTDDDSIWFETSKYMMEVRYKKYERDEDDNPLYETDDKGKSYIVAGNSLGNVTYTFAKGMGGKLPDYDESYVAYLTVGGSYLMNGVDSAGTRRYNINEDSFWAFVAEDTVTEEGLRLKAGSLYIGVRSAASDKKVGALSMANQMNIMPWGAYWASITNAYTVGGISPSSVKGWFTEQMLTTPLIDIGGTRYSGDANGDGRVDTGEMIIESYGYWGWSVLDSRYTTFNYSTGWIHMDHTSGGYWAGLYSPEFHLEDGHTYQLALDFKGNLRSSSLSVGQFYQTSFADFGASYVWLTSNQSSFAHITRTFTVSYEPQWASSGNFRLFINGADGYGTDFYIRNLMLIDLTANQLLTVDGSGVNTAAEVSLYGSDASQGASTADNFDGTSNFDYSFYGNPNMESIDLQAWNMSSDASRYRMFDDTCTEEIRLSNTDVIDFTTFEAHAGEFGRWETYDLYNNEFTGEWWGQAEDVMNRYNSGYNSNGNLVYRWNTTLAGGRIGGNDHVWWYLTEMGQDLDHDGIADVEAHSLVIGVDDGYSGSSLEVTVDVHSYEAVPEGSEYTYVAPLVTLPWEKLLSDGWLEHIYTLPNSTDDKVRPTLLNSWFKNHGSSDTASLGALGVGMYGGVQTFDGSGMDISVCDDFTSLFEGDEQLYSLNLRGWTFDETDGTDAMHAIAEEVQPLTIWPSACSTSTTTPRSPVRSPRFPSTRRAVGWPSRSPRAAWTRPRASSPAASSAPTSSRSSTRTTPWATTTARSPGAGSPARASTSRPV